MPNHAGFAAVAQVRQRTLQEAIRIFHSAGVIPPQLVGQETIPNPGGPGNATLGYNLFLDAPRVRLAAANGGNIALDLRLTGEARITPPSGPVVSGTVLLTLTLHLHPSVLVLGGGLQVRLTVPALSIPALAVEVLSGPLPADLLAGIQTEASRNLLALLLRARLSEMTSMAPPLDIPMAAQLGIGGAVVVTRVVARVLDEALAIGVDLRAADGSLQTSGDLAAIANFLNISDIAACLNPSLVPLALSVVRPTVNAAATAQGVTLDSFDIAVEADHLRLFGHASKDGFGGSFSLRVRPRLGRPETVETWEDEYGGRYTAVNPGTEDVWLDIFDVQLHEELPWWVYLLVGAGCVLLAPATPVIIATVVSMIDSIRGNITRGLEAQGEAGLTGSRTQRASLPGTTAPIVEFTVSQLRVGTGGMQSKLWFRPAWGEGGRVSGPTSLTPQQVLGPPLRYSLSPSPNLYSPLDPLVRIRWQVRRTDTGALVMTKDERMITAGSGAISLDLTLDDRRTAPGFSISCRVYRPLGSAVDELVNQTVNLRIEDRLDRTHPFVRWRHHVYTPQVTKHANGQRELVGYNYIERVSAIHRTDVPGRCRFADQFSHKHVQTPEYLDALPFPTAELVARRAQVCDYCFFGGPDKSTPKIPV